MKAPRSTRDRFAHRWIHWFICLRLHRGGFSGRRAPVSSLASQAMFCFHTCSLAGATPLSLFWPYTQSRNPLSRSQALAVAKCLFQFLSLHSHHEILQTTHTRTPSTYAVAGAGLCYQIWIQCRRGALHVAQSCNGYITICRTSGCTETRAEELQAMGSAQQNSLFVWL